jgi:hypothetical protein
MLGKRSDGFSIMMYLPFESIPVDVQTAESALDDRQLAVVRTVQLSNGVLDPPPQQ